MNGKIKISGPLKTYLNWPVALSILLIIMNAGVYLVNVKAGTLVSLFVAGPFHYLDENGDLADECPGTMANA